MALSQVVLAQRLHTLMMDTLRAKKNVVKIFTGTCRTAYVYDELESPAYSSKHEWVYSADGPLSYTDDILPLYGLLTIATNDEYGVKIAKLTKKASGIRIRFDEDLTASEKTAAWKRVNQRLQDLVKGPAVQAPVSDEVKRALAVPLMAQVDAPVDFNTEPGAINKVNCVHSKKKGTEMGSLRDDFSLSNLKDAFIDKVTHLDRKTVMIIAIIALLLLIVGKYQTIKDILIGIKDKVKRSKNFKAMVEDGTNAINSLKKIVGIKDKGEANAEA